MMTYEFYRDTCGGRADKGSFESAVGTAETVIRALLYPTVPDDLSENQRNAFFRAVCAQVDHDLAGDHAGTARIKSESLGDRSVTYETETAEEFRVRGISVAPQAVLLLENAGCLSRWV